MSKVTSGSMPPGDARLSDQEISLIRLWIDRQGTQTSRASVTEKDVLPIFQMHCVNCHGKTKQEAGLDLRDARKPPKGGRLGSSPHSWKAWQESALHTGSRPRDASIG